jgi:hypothetical protein
VKPLNDGEASISGILDGINDGEAAANDNEVTNALPLPLPLLLVIAGDGGCLPRSSRHSLEYG